MDFFFISVFIIYFGCAFCDDLTIRDRNITSGEHYLSNTCNKNVSKCDKNVDDNNYKKYSKNIGWIAKPLMEALWAFSPDPFSNETTTLCSRHVQLYKKHLENNYLWATQMLDASTLTPSGILSGDNYQLGHFDQCLDINVEIGDNFDIIKGQYCLAKIIINPTFDAFPHYYADDFVKRPYDLHYDPLLSSWTKMKLTEDPTKKQRNRIYWSVCVPSSCSPDEVERGLKDKIIPTLAKHGIDATVTLDENLCHVKSEIELNPNSIIFILFVLLSLILVIISSTIDIAFYRNTKWDCSKSNKKGKLESVMLSFSVYQNFLNLNKTDRSDDLNVMHGMRTYTTILVMLGHRFMFSYASPFHNPEFLERRYRCFEEIFVLNGFLIVDTFFALSGFLTCHMLLTNLKKNDFFNLKLIYFHRLLRIMPLYIIILAMYTNILPLLGDGPLWSLKVGEEVEKCRNNWWANLLFINNYVGADLCMFQSWFLTCDMHFFIFGPVLVYLIHKRPKLGISLTIVSLAISIVIPYVVIYTKNLDGVLKIYMRVVEDPLNNDYIRNIYIKSHNRAGPYIIGIIAAYIYGILKNKNFKFSRFQVIFGTIVCTLSALASMLFAWIFYIPGREYNVVENALYSSLHRIVWSSAISWIIIVGGTTSYGIVSPVLTMKSFIPLSRLTYAVFLCHGMIQLYSVATIRVSEYIRFPKLLSMWTADIMLSFIFALILHLLFEAPLNGLSKILVSSLISKPEKPLKEEKSNVKETKQKSSSNSHTKLHNKINGNNINKKQSKSKMIMDIMANSVVPKIEKKYL